MSPLVALVDEFGLLALVLGVDGLAPFGIALDPSLVQSLVLLLVGLIVVAIRATL